MTLAPRLDLRQSQSLVMTPQLKQAIGLLQLSNLELEAVLMDAAAANPLLRVSGQEGEVEKKIDPKSEEPAEAGAPGGESALDLAPESLDRDRDTGDFGDFSSSGAGGSGFDGDFSDFASGGGPTLSYSGHSYTGRCCPVRSVRRPGLSPWPGRTAAAPHPVPARPAPACPDGPRSLAVTRSSSDPLRSSAQASAGGPTCRSGW